MKVYVVVFDNDERFPIGVFSSRELAERNLPGHVVEEWTVDENASPLDWQKAKQRFDEYYARYKELLGKPGVNVSFAILLAFEPLAQRYNSGERTQELFDEMMAVE